MTAPDRGLTDLAELILVESRRHRGFRPPGASKATCSCGWSGQDLERHITAHVALAVNGRIAELEATVARVRAIVPRVIQGLGRKATYIDVGYASGQKKVWADISAALEGEQR